MKKINLDIEINATREAVWDAIVNVRKYEAWASAFQEGSSFKGGWNKGDSLRFVGINKDGKEEGMISEVAESRFPEYISIRHLGYIINGIADTTSEEIRKWAPSYENYSFEKIDDNKTLFKLDMESNEEYYDMFMEMWPKALAKLKEVSEAV